MRRGSVAVAGIVGIFLTVQFGALALVEPFKAAGYQTVENPSDPTNSALYIGAILVATGVMLLAFRFDADRLVRLFVVTSAAFVSFYVFAVLLPPIVLAGVPVLPVGAAVLLAVALWVYPEWYVIDAAGVIMGMGAAALFGISFGPLPALVLLVALAVYDAISVYGTEHMLTLASGVMDLKVPVLLVIPLTASYSFLEEATSAAEDVGNPDAIEDGNGEATADGTSEDGDEQAGPDSGPMARDAFFIGLGDAVMPTVLVASAAFFLPAPDLGLPGFALTLPAFGAIMGTTVGLLILMRMVMAGRAHAGLPLLNGGAIVGYLLGALAVGIPIIEALGLTPYL